MASVNIARLTTRAPDFQSRLAALLRFDAAQDQAIADTVKAIIREIRARGDAALLEITARFDQLNAASVAALEIMRSAPP